MSQNPGHQPKRFEVFTQLPSGLGFTIKGTDHIFYYDKYGGWKDEYGNYYNEDGLADEEPGDQSEKSISEGSWDSIDDQYQREFAPSKDVQQVFEKQPIYIETNRQKVALAIADNLQELEAYAKISKDQPLRVNFKIDDLEEDEKAPTEKQLAYAFGRKVKVINVFYDDQVSITGYFVVENFKQAAKLIKLEGEEVVDVPLLFEVQPVQELQADPLSNEQKTQRFPKFVSIEQSKKIYTFHLENHAGFSDKKLYQDWLKRIKKVVTEEIQIVKMRSNEKNEKIPVIKIKQSDLDKVKQVLYNEKDVVYATEYKAPSQKQQQQVDKKQQTETEKKQQKEADKKQEESKVEATQ